jgi:chloramphenicol-sensitive protein RarD
MSSPPEVELAVVDAKSAVSSPSSRVTSGILFAVSAYVYWGVAPAYFKLVQPVGLYQVLANRCLFCLLFLLLLLRFWTKCDFEKLYLTLRTDRAVQRHSVLSALSLGSNWMLFIAAVQTGRITEAALAYFINPLMNVALGYLLLKERGVRPAQWFCIGLMACGVGYLTWTHGAVPWLSLAIASTFCLYGLLRKKAVLGPLEGLAADMLVFSPAALFYMVYSAFAGDPRSLFFCSWPLKGGLALSGAITAFPLLMFGAAARRLPYVMMGIIQFLTPTCQLAMGYFVYGEKIEFQERKTGFIIIWLSLAIFAAESIIVFVKTNNMK